MAANGSVANPFEFTFPALPYVPCVKCFLVNPVAFPQASTDISWVQQYVQTITYECFKDRLKFYTLGSNTYDTLMVVVVFKIPARDIDVVGNDPYPLARMLMGKRGNDFGLYSSRPGFDVRTCSKAQMAFSSDDTFITINGTLSNWIKGVATSPTDNVYTEIGFNYPWKGYKPIALFFCTISQTANNENQIYHLPSDRVVNTWGSGYPADGYVRFRDDQPGVGRVYLRRIGNNFWLNYSIIILDHPLPLP